MSFFLRLVGIALVSFCLHYAWEAAHVGLYTGYEHITTLPIAFYATLGDVAYVLLGITLLSVARRSWQWFRSPSHADYGWLALIGLAIAIFVEYKGLGLGRWVYTEAMPIVPILGLGLSPLVQMTILLPLSTWIGVRLGRGRLEA